MSYLLCLNYPKESSKLNFTFKSLGAGQWLLITSPLYCIVICINDILFITVWKMWVTMFKILVYCLVVVWVLWQWSKEVVDGWDFWSDFYCVHLKSLPNLPNCLVVWDKIYLTNYTVIQKQIFIMQCNHAAH